MRQISNSKRALLQVKDNIIEAYQKGGSLKQVASWYKVSPNAIRTILVEEGVQLKPRGRQKKDKSNG